MGGGLLSVPMNVEMELGFQECHKLQMGQGKQNLKKNLIHPLAQSCDCKGTPPPNTGFTALEQISVGSGIWLT